ncbi:MAG TPA: hypothetical protein VG713_00600 [Pirellulales bacterium]|nr:hypothetical protein [Pirellulales bacterium]
MKSLSCAMLVLTLGSNALAQSTPGTPNAPLSRDSATVPAQPQNPNLPGLTQLVKIENHSDTPFFYKLDRSTGPIWTRLYELPPHTAHIFPVSQGGAGARGNPSPISTPGYLFIHYRMAGGWVTYRLLASKSYTYAINADMYGDLSESQLGPPTVAPPGTEPQRLARLRFNHCFQ